MRTDYAVLHRAAAYERRRLYRQYRVHLGSLVQQAAREHQPQQCWTYARLLAGRKHGPKSRSFIAYAANYPRLDAWNSYLQLPGPEGGCSAQCVWHGQFADLSLYWDSCRQLQAVSPAQPLPMITQQQLDNDWNSFQLRLATNKSMKTVPPWSCAAELWQICLSKDASALCPTYQAHIKQLLHHLRQLVCAPVQWSCSWAFPLAKNSGKTGCRAWRLIRILDPLGKHYFSQLWHAVLLQWDDHSYGFVPKRRRDSTVAHKCKRCNGASIPLERAGCKHIMTFQARFPVSHTQP